MNVFISGGCKNGKSSYAQKLALKLHSGRQLYYIATMKPVDDEDQNRIKRHIAERKGLGFETIEIFQDIHKLVDIADPKSLLLIDATTSLLANEMFKGSEVFSSAGKHITMGYDAVFSAFNDVIIVSDYIYASSQRYGEYTEIYRENLALIDRFCAKKCDAVIETVCGNYIAYKGEIDCA